MGIGRRLHVCMSVLRASKICYIVMCIFVLAELEDYFSQSCYYKWMTVFMEIDTYII